MEVSWQFGNSVLDAPCTTPMVAASMHTREEPFLSGVSAVFPQCCCYSLSDIVSNLSLLSRLLTPNSFTFCEHQLFSAGLGAPGDASHLSCPSWCRSKRSCVVVSLDVKLKEMEWFHFLFAFTLASL